MAAPRGIDLTSDHARRVAVGEVTLAQLAGEIGITRQTLHAAFRRRSWPTTAEDQPAKADTAPKAPKKPARRQQPSPAPICPPASNPSPTAALAPPAALPWTTAAELAEFARQQVASVALLALGQLQDQFAGQRLGPGAIKAGAQAAQVAAELLHRAGVLIDGEASQDAPKMIFIEMTAAEIATVQQQAEREFRGEACIDVDDDLAEIDQSDNQ